MIATTIPKQVSVKTAGTMDGVKYLEIELQTSYLQTPVALEYDGVRYGRTGWNSDKNIVYYKDNQRTATSL